MQRVVGVICLCFSGWLFSNDFYVGGQLGVVNMAMGTTYSGSLNYTQVQKTYMLERVRKNNRNMDISGGLYAGYQAKFDQDMNISVEIDLSTGTQSNRRKVPLYAIKSGGNQLVENVTTKDEVSYMAGLSVMPGYKVNAQCEVYGRLGVSLASIKVGKGSGSKTIEPIGWVIGLGGAVDLSYFNEKIQNFIVRCDYRYYQFSEKKVTEKSEYTGNVQLLARTDILYKMSGHAFMIGLHYRI